MVKIVVLRTTRKYWGMYTTVMAMAAVITPPPTEPWSRKAMTMASSRYGKAKMESFSSTRTRSSQPPKYPDTSPTGTPTAIEKHTASRTTSIDVRAP